MGKETHLTSKIKSFTDLNAWKEGHKLVLCIYKVTKDFPKEEQFGLINQIYSMALGSLTEVQNQLLIAKDLGYILREDFQKIADTTVIVSKLINGLIKKSRTIIHDS